tara:strand:+ start:465 stop:803 length:339 start_codon:yes stop_codon:yes gene_type:complete
MPNPGMIPSNIEHSIQVTGHQTRPGVDYTRPSRVGEGITLKKLEDNKKSKNFKKYAIIGAVVIMLVVIVASLVYFFFYSDFINNIGRDKTDIEDDDTIDTPRNTTNPPEDDD